MSDISDIAESSFLSHADSVAEIGSAAFAVQLPLAFVLATLVLIVVASWIAASRGLTRSAY